MTPTTDFTGFPPAAPRFFRALARNNDKTWFAAHRDEYASHAQDPALLVKMTRLGMRGSLFLGQGDLPPILLKVQQGFHLAPELLGCTR